MYKARSNTSLGFYGWSAQAVGIGYIVGLSILVVSRQYGQAMAWLCRAQAHDFFGGRQVVTVRRRRTGH